MELAYDSRIFTEALKGMGIFSYFLTLCFSLHFTQICYKAMVHNGRGFYAAVSVHIQNLHRPIARRKGIRLPQLASALAAETRQ